MSVYARILSRMTDLVWGIPLLAAAIVYARKSREELPPAGIKWGILLSIVGFFIPIVLNQLMTSDFLYRFHKQLAYACAFLVFISWITALKYYTRRRSSIR